MIIDNVFRERKKKTLNKTITLTVHDINNTNIPTVNDSHLNSTIQKTEIKQQNDEMTWFKKKCVTNGLVTLEQKLDLYHLYHQNNYLPKAENFPTKSKLYC